MEQKKVTTTYLEISDLQKLNAKENPDPRFQVIEAEEKQFEINKFLYSFVGKQWEWFQKLNWTDEQWRPYAENDNLRTWIATYKGSPAGYYELQKQEKERVEIAYFGLIERFFGKRLGGYFLSHTIQSAFHWGASSVWVHTCTLDHPSALSNYQARGMEIYKEEVELIDFQP